MAYSTSAPPQALFSRIGGGVAYFAYSSVDAVATVRAAGYITNAKDLGMKAGDLVAVVTTTAGAPSAAPTLCVVSAIGANGSSTLL